MSKKRMSDYDWYCDNCNSKLNSQAGFSYDCGVWYCTNCGSANAINSENILGSGYLGPLIDRFYWDSFHSKDEKLDELYDLPIDYD